MIRFTLREHVTPYGKGSQTAGAAGAYADNTSFTGHLEDDASGLVYMQARHCDALVPRFLATDPALACQSNAGASDATGALS